MWWPGIRQHLKDKYEACRVCQEITRLHYENPPILVQQDLAEVIQPMDELRVDWGSVGRRHFHVVVDLATSYLWVQEFQLMSTDNSISHLHHIMGIFGRALSIGSDGGPSYRAAYERELGIIGTFVEHGGVHHPASQGLAEKKVHLFKLALERNPSRPGQEVQGLVNKLNQREGFPPGVGTPAQRMFRRDIRSILPTLPAQGPLLAAELRDKLAASRDKAMGRRSNCRAVSFTIGEPAMLWDQGLKRYNEPVSIVAPNPGLDGASRSYWVQGANERQKLVHSSWLIKLPPEEPKQEEAEEEFPASTFYYTFNYYAYNACYIFYSFPLHIQYYFSFEGFGDGVNYNLCIFLPRYFLKTQDMDSLDQVTYGLGNSTRAFFTTQPRRSLQALNIQQPASLLLQFSTCCIQQWYSSLCAA